MKKFVAVEIHKDALVIRLAKLAERQIATLVNTMDNVKGTGETVVNDMFSTGLAGLTGCCMEICDSVNKITIFL